MGRTLTAARANDKLCIDGVYMSLDECERNEQDFLSVCVQGKEMGFDGKSLIHPSQVPACNFAFSPSDADVENASRVVSAYNDIMDVRISVCLLMLIVTQSLTSLLSIPVFLHPSLI